MKKRFVDNGLQLSSFENEVWVKCPSCCNQAITRRFQEEKKVRLTCSHCGYSQDKSTLIHKNAELIQPAHQYFDVELWFLTPLGNQGLIWAYNPKHAAYLFEYVSAEIREKKLRKHFTLLEKLPRFYHLARNRKTVTDILSKWVL